jgi:FtsZ-interacting cell division protein ZipA
MSEFQIGLLAIGGLVVAGVLAYNRIQERGARQSAERAFRSLHDDALMDAPASGRGQNAQLHEPQAEQPREPVRTLARHATSAPLAEPDPAVDYIIEFRTEQAGAAAAVEEQWPAIERRHMPRAFLSAGADGISWRAGLQLVSRDGAIGEADLIEFRSAVETLAAAIGGTVSAPEMRAAVEAARQLDDFCVDADVQVVVHLQGGPFPGTKVRAAAEAGGLALEADGRFALRDPEQRLLYTLAARDGSAFSAAAMKDAMPAALSLTLDVARTPDTRRSFESMARLAHQLAAVLEGSIVDDNGNVLDERAVIAIAQQLDAASAGMQARGITPGSPTALRLFS